MIHLRTAGLIVMLLALGAAGCGGPPETENETNLNVESSALQPNSDIRICKPPISIGIAFQCPQAGCCLQRTFTSPPRYFCYDCF